ncbi:hypothetical protein ACIBCO_36510 [Streptomyces violascens]|uniref:hypothetical protein n=1 Tax=Streptomyces violascens TaxID=67381 RepID=UPI0037ABE64B
MTRDANIRRAGFYRSASDISTTSSPDPHHWEQRASHYLEQGQVILAASQWVDDLMDANNKNICQYSLHTDGVWAWPASLAYYVRRYHVNLPPEFLAHMASNNWEVDGLDDASLEEIGEALIADLEE